MNENSLIKDIGRSYIVSSLLPAGLFVSLGVLLYRGFAPLILTNRVIEKDEIYGSQWFLFIVFTVWTAFCLYSMTHWTVKFFEGYYIPKSLSKRMIKVLKRTWHQKQTKNIRKFFKLQSLLSPDQVDLYQKYRLKARVDYTNLETLSPLDKKFLLPTRLGNVLRASEIYPHERYNLDGIVLWPRLVQVLPNQFGNSIEEKNNQMIFLLNSALLCYLNGLFSLVVGFIRLPCQIFPELKICQVDSNAMNFFERGFQSISPLEYVLVGFAWMVAGYLIYYLGVKAAEALALDIRTGFDLYRFELLKQLNQPLPGTIEEERSAWAKISEFLICGDKLGTKPYQIIYYGKRSETEDWAPFKPKPAVVTKKEPTKNFICRWFNKKILKET